MRHPAEAEIDIAIQEFLALRDPLAPPPAQLEARLVPADSGAREGIAEDEQ